MRETFRFGDGGTKDSDTRVRFPVAAAKVPHFIKAYLLEIPGLNLLLGRDYLESVHAEIKTSPPRLRDGMRLDLTRQMFHRIGRLDTICWT